MPTFDSSFEKIETYLRDKFASEKHVIFFDEIISNTVRKFQAIHLRDKTINSFWQRLTITVQLNDTSNPAISITGKYKSGLSIAFFGRLPKLSAYKKDLVADFSDTIEITERLLESEIRNLL